MKMQRPPEAHGDGEAMYDADFVNPDPCAGTGFRFVILLSGERPSPFSTYWSDERKIGLGTRPKYVYQRLAGSTSANGV